MEDITAYAAFGGLVWTVVQFFKFLDAKQWTSVKNQAFSWLAGVGITLIGAQTSFAAEIPAFGGNLATANTWDQIFFGLTVAGVAGVAFSFKKAVDGGDSDKVVS